MRIAIGYTTDENEKMDKTFNQTEVITAVIKEGSSIIDPVLFISTPSNLNINYVWIPVWNRYYYINNITALTGERVQLACHVDVLKSFADQIRKCMAIINKQEGSTYTSDYLNDGSYYTLCKEANQAYSFNIPSTYTSFYTMATAGHSN